MMLESGRVVRQSDDLNGKRRSERVTCFLQFHTSFAFSNCPRCSSCLLASLCEMKAWRGRDRTRPEIGGGRGTRGGGTMSGPGRRTDKVMVLVILLYAVGWGLANGSRSRTSLANSNMVLVSSWTTRLRTGDATKFTCI